LQRNPELRSFRVGVRVESGAPWPLPKIEVWAIALPTKGLSKFNDESVHFNVFWTVFYPNPKTGKGGRLSGRCKVRKAENSGYCYYYNKCQDLSDAITAVAGALYNRPMQIKWY